jgi:hypothetical protein
MFASDDVPYFSRFVVKFIEIFAAGLATAVSGYMIAHLAGALSSSTPATVGTAVQDAPSAGAVSSLPPAKPSAPASAETNEQHPPPVQEANAPALAQPAQGAESSHESSRGNATKAVVGRKHPETDKHLEADKRTESDTSAAASAAEPKRDQEETKHAQDAVLARIRAALANSNAKKTTPPDTRQPAGNGSRANAAIGSQSPPVDKRPSASAVTVASPTSANPVSPSIQQPVQQPVQLPAPTEPTPLTTVEIPSRPVATVRTAPVPAPTSQDDSGMFSGLDRLRHDPLATSDDAPRPPMPVGQ